MPKSKASDVVTVHTTSMKQDRETGSATYELFRYIATLALKPYIELRGFRNTPRKLFSLPEVYDHSTLNRTIMLQHFDNTLRIASDATNGTNGTNNGTNGTNNGTNGYPSLILTSAFEELTLTNSLASANKATTGEHITFPAKETAAIFRTVQERLVPPQCLHESIPIAWTVVPVGPKLLPRVSGYFQSQELEEFILHYAGYSIWSAEKQKGREEPDEPGEAEKPDKSERSEEPGEPQVPDEAA